MTNRLASASSPYLRQHRDNPVHWFQWGDEAFAEAQRTGKPILLSVGYSACHWCHVMAHESFENNDVADVMNSLFINVKVDREERPDVDAVYMDAVQALTGRGGWPMTVFCTPTGEPFYGGTYYPRETFVKLMQAVDDAWTNRRDELQQNVDALVEAIGRTAHIAPAIDIDIPELITTTLNGITNSFDSQWGGFGNAPKFPSTFAIDLLLREFQISQNPLLLEMAETSLDAMAAGGMYDHIGGGFARYSVDEKWLVPHFEKMLYDQAQLTRVYLHAWQTTGDARHLQTTREIIEYVLRDLRHESGGFYSAEDADSLDEHGHSEEGAFYTFTPDEIRAITGDKADEALAWWNITDAGNFEGRNIPHRIPQRGHIERPQVIDQARREIFEAREKRTRPGLDNKVLLEWNAMMLSVLCEAASALNDHVLTNAAIKNAQFILRNLASSSGGWHRSWQPDAQPQAQHTALAHDLAHLVDAMTRMYELTADHSYLEVATSTAHQLIDQHWDNENGGLFTVSRMAEQLVVRQKDLMDNATPSSNSVAAMAFLRLSAITGDESLAQRAHDILRLLGRVAPSAPSAFCFAMSAALLQHHGISEIVIPGNNDTLLQVAREQWRPHAVIAWGDSFASPLWADRSDGYAYVCKNYACLLPASTPEELRARLATK
ncbi:MAG: hypothetical protein RLZ18_345 [Actinomycetota bacterium]